MATGYSALQLIRAEDIHVLLTDLMMPGLSGHELVEAALRHHPRLVPVVMTGYPSLDNAVSTLRIGAFDFVVKPLALKQLVTTVERAWHHGLLSQPLRSARPSASARPDCEAEPIRVLLLEDNPGDALLIEELLGGPDAAASSFAITHATRVSEALALLEHGEEAFDVALLDLSLPDCSGIEAFVKIHLKAPALPKVVLSGTADPKLREQVMLCGAQEFLLKRSMATAELLSSRLHYAIDRHRLLQELEHLARTVGADGITRRKLLERTSEALVVVDQAGAVLYANPAAETLFAVKGGLVGEVVGIPAVAGDTAEIQIARPGAEARICELRTTDTLWESTPAAIVSIRDITVRARAEEKIRASEQRLSLLLEQLPATVWTVDEELRVTSSRGEHAPSLDAVSSPQAGARLVDYLGLDSPNCEPIIRHRQALTGKSTSYELERDGRVYDTHLKPLRSKDNRIVGVAGVTLDVTERRKLQTQLLQSQKLEAIGQLAAGIAHEINTPMQYIGDNTEFLRLVFTRLKKLTLDFLGLLEQARHGTIAPEQIADLDKVVAHTDLDYLLEQVPIAIEHCLDGIARVTEIVGAMRDFSHPGREQKAPEDLERLIVSTLTVARNELKHVAEVSTDFDPSLPHVPCLPGELNQVLLNLVVNAAHAIAEAGEAGETNKKGKLTVQTLRNGPWAEIRVSDNGAGIPPEIQTKIFNPFFTTKEPGKGTGQGLAIAHSVVVDKHGGTLTFRSEQGKGSTFIIRLPLGPGSESSALTEEL